MNDHSTTCNPERIELFLGHKLSGEEQRAFELHLDHCNDCRRQLESTAAGDDIWLGVRDSLRGQEPPTDSLQSGAARLDSAADGDASLHHGTVLKLLAPTDDDRMLGRLGTYEVMGVIGSGGMGIVLKAFDSALNRYVAIKILSPHLGSSGAARKRFSREAQAAAAVVHDTVMEIYGVANVDGLPYLVMPYVRGSSLQRRLDDEGPLAVVEILRIGMQAATGLSAAHAQGLVHRDVKPANILLPHGIARVKLTDFGLARAVDDASLTVTGVIAGTPQYMSPEQARGESVDHRSDLFSLGSVLYAMCTGRAPFRAESSYGVLQLVTHEEPRPIREINPDIPEWLCRIIARLMSKQPNDRFASATEVAELLEACLAHVQQPDLVSLPLGTLMPASRARLPRRRSPPLSTILLGGASIFSAVFAGMLIVLQLNKGTITIKSDADNVPVRITQGDKVVENLTVKRTGASVRIAAGRYRVELLAKADSLVVKDGTFTLTRGKEHVATIERINEAASNEPANRTEPHITPLWNEFGVTSAPVSPLTAKVLEWIGLHFKPITKESFREKNVFAKQSGGLDVTFVRSNGPAEKAGMHEVDIVVRLQGRPIVSLDDLDSAMRDAVEQIGRGDADALQWDVLRSGETVPVPVPLPVRQLDLPRPTSGVFFPFHYEEKGKQIDFERIELVNQTIPADEFAVDRSRRPPR